jgi:hypothetical protein
MPRVSSELLQPVEVSQEQVQWNLGMLNPKQRAFVEQLMSDEQFCLSNAARKAGYKHPAADGLRLIKEPKVAQVIGKLIHRRSVENSITADRVLREIASIGFVNPKHCLDSSGQVMDLKDMPDDVAATIREFEIIYEENGEESVFKKIKLKFWDKEEALQMLARHVGILKEMAPNLNFISVNWHDLYSSIGEMAARMHEDPIEKCIAEAGRTEITEVVEHGR